MTDFNFEGFPKIARWSREIIITEKLDGTNAQVIIEGDKIGAGSRNRLITPEDDNYGFARWVQENRETLIRDLGDGRHFGEWFGLGIQRGYGMKVKQFALFNSTRWKDQVFATPNLTVVPELYRGMMDEHYINLHMAVLKEQGSWASLGFMRPEGIIIYHTAARTMFKKTFEKDSEGKGE